MVVSKNMTASSPREVFIVDGSRTPFLKVGTKPNPWSASDLAVAAAAPLLLRYDFKPEAIQEVVAGSVNQAADELNIGRLTALRLGCGYKTEGYTVQRNCASSLQAIDNASCDIRSGRQDLVIAGGTECMSHAPWLWSSDFVNWMAEFRSSSNVMQKIKRLFALRPRFFKPVFSLIKGLKDPVVELSMGQTAELLAEEFNITREEMDAFSLQSHLKAVAGKKNKHFSEINSLYDWQGNHVDFDTGVRENSSLEKLATLKPAFEKPFGTVTAGNSSPISDGAAFVLMASQKAIEQYQLPVLGKIIDFGWRALSPAKMGLGPVYAIAALLDKTGLKLEEIDYWEINEAFAAQVLACLKIMESQELCQKYLGRNALGKIPPDRLNVDGGAIAVGHPVGASGSRLVLHLLEVLKRNNARYGIASLCIGGGQGGAILVENPNFG